MSDRTITYDSFGRPANSQLAASTGTFGYVTSYNPSNGKIATVTHPSGFVEQSTYNQYGYLCLITGNSGTPTCGNPGGAQVFFTLNTRDAELHLTQSTAGNGVVTNQAFSALTGLIQAQTAGAGNSVASFSYSFDTIGNLTARSDSVESYTENFCYDTNLNRLTNYNTGPLGSSSCMGGKTVAYDGAGLGNIISKSDVGTYAYPASGPESVLPHAVSSITGTADGLTNPQYSYDGNGNLGCISTEAQCQGTIAKAVQTTSFNMAAVILQGTTSVAIGYDSEHKRLVQTSTVSGETTTTTYVNDPASGAMAENIATGGVPSWRDYVIVDGAIVAVRTISGGPVWGTAVWGQFTWGAATTTWAYFVLDHLGSVAVITDGSGAVTERLSYDPWGKRRNANGSDAACGTITSPQTRGFTNQEQLDQVCFVNLNARIYDPSIGKFLSADPVVGNIYLPNAFNRYAYVLNNPLSFTDTSGLCFLGCFWTNPIFGVALDIGLFAIGLPELELTNGLVWGTSLTEQIASLGLPTLLANGALAGAVSAGVTGGNVLKGAEFGALGAGLSFGVAPAISGQIAGALSPTLGEEVAQDASAIIAQGITGGIASIAQGENFGSGFLAGGVGSLAGPLGFSGGQFDPANLIVSTALGGAASVLGGGKFANGAVTSAFAYVATSSLQSAGEPNQTIRPAQGAGISLSTAVGYVERGTVEFLDALEGAAGGVLTVASVLLSGDTPQYQMYYHYGFAADEASFTNGLRSPAWATDTPT